MKKVNTDDKEFDNFLNILSYDIVDANIHWKLHKDLKKSQNEYLEELNESAHFWFFTINAHAEVAIYKLCRIYEFNSKTLNLFSLLNMIKDHLHIFDTKNFKERLKNNPYVESLSQNARRPDDKLLDEDISYLKKRNNYKSSHAATKLHFLRNWIFSHRDINQIRTPKKISLLYEDITEMSEKALSIINRYSDLFRASTHSDNIAGADDYLDVLKYVRDGIKKMDQEAEDEIADLISSDKNITLE